jgi:hypothetical protein
VSENLACRSRVFGVVDLGSKWDLDFQVSSRSARLVGTFTVSSPLRGVDRAEAEVVEGVQPFVADEDDGAAMAAISPRRTSPGNVLFPAEGETAVASTPAADMNDGFV